MKKLTFDWKKILIRWPMIIVVLIFLTAGFVKWQSNAMPELSPSATAPLPSPNAWDYFGAADSLLVDPIEYAAEPPVAPPPGITAYELADPKNDYRAYTLADKDEMVRQNLPVFSKIEDGLRYAYMNPMKPQWDAKFTYLPNDRKLVRALKVAGDCRASHGDWAGAMNYYLDGVNMGADIPHGAPLIGTLVGVSCEAESRKGIYSLIPHLTQGQAESAERRLEHIEMLEVTPSESLRNEEHFTQGSLLYQFSRPGWRGYYVSILGGTYANPGTLDQSVELRIESPKTIYTNYTNYLDKSVALTALPWPVQITRPVPPLPTDPYNNILLPIFSGSVFETDYSLAQNRMLEIELGLQAYDRKIGHYPASLKSIAPTYLSQLPVDPFSNNEPFHYRQRGSTYLLYSIGPDAIDNGGTPARNEDPSSMANPFIIRNASAKGDIVAGVNQ